MEPRDISWLPSNQFRHSTIRLPRPAINCRLRKATSSTWGNCRWMAWIAQREMKQGDVFDAGYLARFFQVVYHDIGISQSYSVVQKQSVNPQEKTVDVALHFVPKK